MALRILMPKTGAQCRNAVAAGQPEHHRSLIRAMRTISTMPMAGHDEQ